jgi:hypothetical protein
MKVKHSDLVKEYKADFAKKLSAMELTQKHKTKIAAELDKSISTIERYTSGDVIEIRSLLLAESILSTAKEVLRAKPVASSEA